LRIGAAYSCLPRDHTATFPPIWRGDPAFIPIIVRDRERRKATRLRRNKAQRLAEALIGTAYFPHWLSFLIDNPLRSLLISPSTLVERLALRPEARILEVGAGSGYFSEELAKLVPLGHLEILDLQAEMLAKARRKIARVRFSNVSFTQSDACSLPFQDASFDFAVLVAVLGEVRDEPRCLQSLWRVVRPGGVVAVHEHFPDPDFIRPDALRSKMEKEAFSFHRQFGPSWNYTALFTKPTSPAK
jgi:SAM-dependent methyltransferase